MQLFNAPLSSVATVIFFSYVQASYLQNDLSFGTSERISPNLRAIPNWHILGHPSPPEILSNRLVLTPPHPGNQRGAIWSEKVLEHAEWTADVDFRTTGPERGGGNLQIWYAKDGQNNIGTASVYTVGKFDGLGLIIDQYASSGGYIRGFLNDGTTDYKNHHSVDSLAFGHCEYSYRNLGRPSRLAIKQSSNGLSVSFDGVLCFESSKIRLPLGYNFGISAASAENPDSFELFKFVTTTESHAADSPGSKAEHQYNAAETHNQHSSTDHGTIPAYSDPPEEPASKFTSSAEQFADLHNRLQVMMKHISTAHRDTMAFQRDSDGNWKDLFSRLDRIYASQQMLESKLDSISQDTRNMKGELHTALERHVQGIRSDVRSTKDSMMDGIGGVRTGLGWGGLLVVVLGSQFLTVGTYLVYKRRKAGNHLKYL